MTECPLCTPEGDDSTLLWRDDRCRVILCRDADYPGFCRVIWGAHVAEMTDLTPKERAHLMAVVWDVEAVLRKVMQPTKMNLASLGNQVPHLHWHLIPRFSDDRHFPDPIWADPQREGHARAVDPARLHDELLALRSAAEPV